MGGYTGFTSILSPLYMYVLTMELLEKIREKTFKNLLLP